MQEPAEENLEVGWGGSLELEGTLGETVGKRTALEGVGATAAGTSESPWHLTLRRFLSHPQINKQNEQMHALLAIALTMYPMRIDESIHLQLREKYGDKMLRMQKGDPQVYEELFSYSCPKFLSPVVPNYDNVHPNYHKEPFLQQLKVFADEVQQQAQLSTIRSFLKLYTTMPVAKLAGFLDLTEQEFRIQLLVFKHKMKNLVWTSGISALDGEFQSASEVDFYIDKVRLPPGLGLWGPLFTHPAINTDRAPTALSIWDLAVNKIHKDFCPRADVLM